MTTINNTNKGLFNNSSIEKAGELNKVTIFNSITNESVTGQSTAALSFTWTAKFKDLKSVMPTVGGAIQEMEDKGLLAGGNFATSKIYEGGEYLSYSINLRVNDTYGDGAPMKAALVLGRWTTSFDWIGTSFDTTGIQIEDMIGRPSGTKSLNSGVLSKGKGQSKKFSDTDAVSKIASIAKEALGGGSFAKAGINALGLLTDMKLDVFIGDWFHGDGNMVMESVSQTFSTHHGPAGPLFCDFVINLSSINIMTKNQVSKLFPLLKVSSDGKVISSAQSIEVKKTRYEE